MTMEPIKPRPLRPGDTISVVAPAGPVKRERIEKAFALLELRGYRIKTHGDVFRARGYLAGDDDTRAGELLAAFADPESTAVWCARGGYGVGRILERLDYEHIRRHPKVFVGFSDITLLHLALQNRTGLVTYHGPNLQDGFGAAEPMSPTTEAALWRAIGGAEQPTYTYAETGTDGIALRTIAPGAARGRLTGGNLSVLAGIMGSRYEIETAGRILLLEDVDEPVYRVDRYFAQLALAGKLQAVAGVMLGGFTYDQPPEAGTDTALAELMSDYFGRLGVPVLAGLPAGHQRENWALPLNTLVELDADAGRVRVVESPVATAD